MKKLICLIFILAYVTVSFAIANEFNSLKTNNCKLNDKMKAKLIASSTHSVDDITINDCTYTWYISNKKYFFQVQPKEQEESIRTPSSQKKEIQVFSVLLYSGVASIASTDKVSSTTEKAVSDLGYGISLSWDHLWTKRMSFFVVGSLKDFEFKTSSTRSLNKASNTQSYIGAGLNIKLGDRVTLTPSFGMGESFILNSDGGTELSIDKISIPTVSLGAKVKLYQFESGFSFDLNVRGGALLPTNQRGYETEQGHYYNLSLGSSYDLNGKKLFINAGIANRELEVGDAKQISKDLGISAGVGWSF